jgi:hypothetical protein
MVLDSEDCLRQVMAIRGALGANVVDLTSGLSVGSAGRMPNGDPQLTAAGVVSVLHASLSNAAFASVGQPTTVDDIVVTAQNGYHLIQFVPGRPNARVVLYVWLDRVLGNLAMTQRRLRTTTSELVAG